MKNKRNRQKVVSLIAERFGDRLTCTGEFNGMKYKMCFYCHDCKQHFLQVVASLIDPRKLFSTRCMCDSGLWTRKGHNCLPEWDQWDKDKPIRGELDTWKPPKNYSYKNWNDWGN